MLILSGDRWGYGAPSPGNAGRARASEPRFRRVRARPTPARPGWSLGVSDGGLDAANERVPHIRYSVPPGDHGSSARAHRSDHMAHGESEVVGQGLALHPQRVLLVRPDWPCGADVRSSDITTRCQGHFRTKVAQHPAGNIGKRCTCVVFRRHRRYLRPQPFGALVVLERSPRSHAAVLTRTARPVLAGVRFAGAPRPLVELSPPSSGEVRGSQQHPEAPLVAWLASKTRRDPSDPPQPRHRSIFPP